MPQSALISETPPGALATLRPGDGVEGVYACTRKERLLARSGAPYLALELRELRFKAPELSSRQIRRRIYG